MDETSSPNFAVFSAFLWKDVHSNVDTNRLLAELAIPVAFNVATKRDVPFAQIIIPAHVAHQSTVKAWLLLW